MENIHIKTERLIITKFDESMARSLHIQSLDEDTRRFLPDEVFETEARARDVIRHLMQCYGSVEGPFVYSVSCLFCDENIGYVQAVWLGDDNLEIGYKIAEKYTGKGYATEALCAFIPVAMSELGVSEIWGIVHAGNVASCRVLEKVGFRLVRRYAREYHGEAREVCEYLYTAEMSMR